MQQIAHSPIQTNQQNIFLLHHGCNNKNVPYWTLIEMLPSYTDSILNHMLLWKFKLKIILCYIFFKCNLYLIIFNFVLRITVSSVGAAVDGWREI